jgi:hypothetical protein
VAGGRAALRRRGPPDRARQGHAGSQRRRGAGDHLRRARRPGRPVHLREQAVRRVLRELAARPRDRGDPPVRVPGPPVTGAAR